MTSDAKKGDWRAQLRQIGQILATPPPPPTPPTPPDPSDPPTPPPIPSTPSSIPPPSITDLFPYEARTRSRRKKAARILNGNSANPAARNQRTAISKAKKRQIFRRDKYTCMFCGCQFSEAALTIHHKVKIEEGGGNGIDNLAASCEPCQNKHHAHESSISQADYRKGAEHPEGGGSQHSSATT